MLKREKYLSRIRPYYESDLIKSIAGIRRCGKSTILKQIIEELSEHVSDDQILFYDFEDFDNEQYLHDPQGFYHDVKDRIAALAGRKAYVLIDEVQYMERYIPVIASISSRCFCFCDRLDLHPYIRRAGKQAHWTLRGILSFPILL